MQANAHVLSPKRHVCRVFRILPPSASSAAGKQPAPCDKWSWCKHGKYKDFLGHSFTIRLPVKLMGKHFSSRPHDSARWHILRVWSGPCEPCGARCSDTVVSSSAAPKLNLLSYIDHPLRGIIAAHRSCLESCTRDDRAAPEISHCE